MKNWIIFIVIWTTLVYDFIAHMMWGAWTVDESEKKEVNFGWLRDIGSQGQHFPSFVNYLDFAGGTVIHVTSGWSALIASVILGKRRNWNGENKGAIPPHSLPLALLGTCLMWFGW